MLNHCFSLLNYFKLGISFFKEIWVVNSHIRYCLIFKFLVGFYKLRLSFRQRWVCFANSLSYLLGLLNSYWKDVLRGRPSLSVTAWLLYHVVFCLSSTFFKVFWDFFQKRNASVKTLGKLSKVTPLTLTNDTIFKVLYRHAGFVVSAGNAGHAVWPANKSRFVARRATRQLCYNTTIAGICQHIFSDSGSCLFFVPTE